MVSTPQIDSPVAEKTNEAGSMDIDEDRTSLEDEQEGESEGRCIRAMADPVRRQSRRVTVGPPRRQSKRLMAQK